MKNDGERFMLTILTDNRSMDETMWVFERKDLPYQKGRLFNGCFTPYLVLLCENGYIMSRCR